MIRKDDAKHRKPVHDVFQNIYKECASAEQDDPANVNFICTENAQEAVSFPRAEMEFIFYANVVLKSCVSLPQPPPSPRPSW